MVTDVPRAGGLRALTRDAVRERIADQALILFDENGFDQTTVEDIVRSVGISPRSFFRYFPNKEDVVLADLIVARSETRDRVAAYLTLQSPWRALHLGMRDGAARIDDDAVRWLRRLRIIRSTASLRGSNLEKLLTWSALLVPVVSPHIRADKRLGDLPARAVVASAFACLDAALTSWTEAGGKVPFRHVLDTAFAAIEENATA